MQTMESSDLTFDGADLKRAAAVLQRLGLRLLRDLLSDGPGLPPREWFRASEAAVFGRAPEGLLQEIYRVFHSASDAAIASKIRVALRRSEPGGLVRRLRAHVALHRRGWGGFLVPDRLWPLLAHAAWGAPRFQLRAGRLLWEHMRRSLIVAADDFPPPRVAVNTMWLVLATSPVRESPLVQLGLRDRGVRRAVTRVQAAAQRLATTGLPADFWSQWIAWQAGRSPNRLSLLWPALGNYLNQSQLASVQDPADLAGAIDPGARASWREARELRAVYDRWYPANKEPIDVQRP
jgi:hypothetical protein